MEVTELLKRISSEKQAVLAEKYSVDGLVRLKEVAASYNGEYQLIWSDELLKEIEKRPKSVGIGSGLPSLDSITGGFLSQQLVTVSAHSKHGKTAFSMFLMENMEPQSPVMIPLEQSNEELVIQRRDNGYSIPRFLSPRRIAARVTLDWIEERVVEGIAKFDTKIVVIDHLGYIDDFGAEGRYARENLAYRIQVLMQGLKGLAKKWGVCIVLLCHIQQADEGKPPSLQDLKGSSAILQESDKVIMLWRKNSLKKKVRVYEDRTMISVLANRQTGRNGSIGAVFDRSTGRFKEDNGWVESLTRAAENEVELEDMMDGI